MRGSTAPVTGTSTREVAAIRAGWPVPAEGWAGPAEFCGANGVRYEVLERCA